ncbi:PASTA domain protein [Mycobacterium xenopi 3993]|nr:PASTA domain protein [Mycobacterium xenopi 3993]
MIGTDPAANASVSAGDEITVNVSTGPEQREVPDVSSLSYADAVKKLTAAGFGRFKQASSPSTPELKGRVVGTNPPANQTSAITNVITIVVGSGPPPSRFRTWPAKPLTSRRRISPSTGSPNSARLRSTAPPGRRRDWHQSACGRDGSGGLGDRIAGLQGQPVRDARPVRVVLDRRRTTAARAGLDGCAGQGADVDAGGDKHNRVVYQSPAAGQGVNKDGTITLKFGQ